MITISKFSKSNPRFVNLLSRKGTLSGDVEKTVDEIIDSIRNDGDKALYHYMSKYDGVDLNNIGLMVTDEEFANAKEMVSQEFKDAVKGACDNLFKFHQRQTNSGYTEEYEDGVVLERKYIPLESVAVTVPGNMAALVSTLYMNLIPAIVAGVPNIYVLTKPRKDGSIDEHLLYVADYLNVKNYYKISGAQGLAAVALGTESVKKVDAILGPGNNYTQAAKKKLYGEVKIDSLAGPSEIAIIADETANPRFVAADMLSQAEHGTGFEACSTFCTSKKLADEIKTLIEENHLSPITKIALNNFGDVFIVDSIEEGIEATNMIAPEHVEIMVENPEEYVGLLKNAGAVFVGEYSSEPVGDYFCGTNHILPTCGTARFSSGMSVNEFMRGYSVIRYSKQAIDKNGKAIIELAESEKMMAHALAIRVRM